MWFYSVFALWPTYISYQYLSTGHYSSPSVDRLPTYVRGAFSRLAVYSSTSCPFFFSVIPITAGKCETSSWCPVSIVRRNLWIHQQKIGGSVQRVWSGFMHKTCCGRPNGLDTACHTYLPKAREAQLGLGAAFSVSVYLQKGINEMAQGLSERIMLWSCSTL